MSEKPKIYTVLPDEIRQAHAHGQWVLDQVGGIINFACDETEPHVPDVEPMARRLEDFAASSQLFMEFESPHLPGRYFLHRAALEHIILTQPAWSAKVRPRSNGTVDLRDNESGLPVVRRKLN